MELSLMRASVAEPTWLAPHDESALRWALSLARISSIAVPGEHGAVQGVVEVDHATNAYRTKLFALLEKLVDHERVTSRDGVVAQIPAIRRLAKDERASLLELF